MPRRDRSTTSKGSGTPQERDTGNERATRAILQRIDARLAQLERELQQSRPLLAERRRLLQARRAISAEPLPSPDYIRRLTRSELIEYLREHPGQRATQIARALGVARGTVSGHLHRGRDQLFERRSDGWHVREGVEG